MRRQLAVRLAALAVVLAAGVVSARAQTFTVGDIEYKVTTSGHYKYDEVSVIDYLGSGGHVSIREFVGYEGYTFKVTGIGEEAFRDCTGLTSIDLPDGLTSIEDYAFTDCTGLTSIDLPDGLTSIGGLAFYGCTSLISIDLPAGLTDIGWGAFGNCTGLTSIDLPAGLTSIEGYAFRGCTGLTSIDLPAGLTSIGDCAFYGCTGLTSIDLPDGLTSIGDCAFYGCTGLTSIDLPDGVTSIESYTFRDCTGLTSIDLPAGLTSIGWRAFYGCTSLTTVGMPANLEEVDDDDVFPESVSAIIYRGGDYDVAALFSRQLDCIVALEPINGLSSVVIETLEAVAKDGCEIFWFNDGRLPSLSNVSAKFYTFKKDGFPEGLEVVSLFVVGGQERHAYTGESNVFDIDIEGNTSSSVLESLGATGIDAGDYNIDEVAFSFRNDSRHIYIPEVRVSIDEPLHFVIEQAPLGVSLSPVSITYGERRPDDFDVVYDGFLGDDDESSISVIPSVECASAEYPVAGTYPVTVSGGEARNYYFEYADGELTVEKATLSVTGDSYTVTYGDELPDFGYDIEGFVLGDDEGDLSALPSVRLLSNPNAGSYTLSITGGEADNYRFDYHPGRLTVLKAAQTIDWPQDFTSGLSQGDMVEITATATSGLWITYESTNVDVAEVIHIDGRPYLNCVNDGSANIIATQPGDGNHEAAPSVTRRVNVGHGSGLAPSASSPSVGCRPSPARDVLEVTGTDASMTAAVYSPSGAMVLSSRCADGMTRLDVSRLDAGTYILVVSGGDGATARLRFAKE